MRNRKDLNFLQKMWFDTVTNPKTGMYSMTSLQVFFATFVCFLLSTALCLEIHIWPEQSLNVIPPPDWLVNSWMLVAFGFAGLNQYGKIQAMKLDAENPELPKNTANE